MNKIKLLILSLVVILVTGCGGRKNAEQAFADGDLKNGSTEQEVKELLGSICSTSYVEGDDRYKGISYQVNDVWYDIWFKKVDNGTYVVYSHGKSEGEPFQTTGGRVFPLDESQKDEPSEFEKERAAENLALKKKFDSISVSSYPTSRDEFTTSDLKMYELCGHVKEIKGEAMFDKTGKLIKLIGYGYDEQGNAYDVDKFTRDGKGRIVKFTYKRLGSSCYTNIRYDSEGYISVWDDEADGETTYSYRNGLLDSFERFIMEDKTSYTIRYTKFDSHGNWVERIVLNGTSYYEGKRTIIYY